MSSPGGRSPHSCIRLLRPDRIHDHLYRLRWQIELLFKRLKSLLHLDALPSREGPTAKSWMLARLTAAALAQRLVQPAGPLSPWGYVLRGTDPIPEGKKKNPRTHSAWSRFRMTLWALRVAVLGRGPWLVIENPENLERLCNSRRERELEGHELNQQMALFY